MIETIYDLRNADDIPSPALVYYKSALQANAREAIRVAGGADRLWPHLKTHKMPAMLRMQMELGIRRFKCATIAEAEMAAQSGVPEVLVSYPLIGPAIKRFITLCRLYPGTRYWALGDDMRQLRELGRAAERENRRQPVVIDVDIGLHRTGVPADALDAFYREASRIQGLEVRGFHCYDGQNKMTDTDERMREVEKCVAPVYAARDALVKDGLPCDTLIMGGTPSFPCHAKWPGVFLSPGTLFVNDYSHVSLHPDLKYTPAGVVLSRVISLPCDDRFTIDLGYKGIASDPAGARGVIANLPETEPVAQSEEHWVFRMLPGAVDKRPKVGDVVYVIPTHICPTSALYSSVLVADKGEIVDTWEVAARNRKLTV